MRPQTIDVIRKMLERFPNGRGEPVKSEEEIAHAEKRLGVVFSKDYREFLTTFGGANVGKRTVYGLHLPPRLNNKTYRPENNRSFLVEDATLYFRKEGWPGVESWYVVSVDYSGNPIGLDSAGAVWISDHNQMNVEKLHDGFEDWINEDCLAIEDDEDADS